MCRMCKCPCLRVREYTYVCVCVCVWVRWMGGWVVGGGARVAHPSLVKVPTTEFVVPVLVARLMLLVL